MLKITRMAIMAIAACTVVFSACNKELKQAPASEVATVSKKAADDLAIAKTNWNTNAGKLATMTSFTPAGSITSAAAKEEMINRIMSDDAMAAYGNILNPSSMHLNTISELQSQNADTKATMRGYLDQQISVGDAVVNISWQTGQKSFTSQCIVHGDEIAWDNLLTSCFMMDENPVVTLSQPIDKAAKGTNAAKTAYAGSYWQSNTWTAGWVWGGHRGDMGEKITIYCYSSGYVYSTDHEDWANMTLGSAKSYSKTIVNSGSYGKIQYALGISTPFASLSYDSKGFKVSVSGLGSSMVHNGSHTLYPW